MLMRRSLNKQSPTMSSTMTMKRVRDQLLMWICEKHASNSFLSRELLRNKALELSREFGLIGFKASDQWITTFLKTYGFSSSLTSCDGPIFNDYHIWINLLRPILSQYKYKDLFNVDELSMYSNIPPTSVLSVIKQGVLHEDHKTKHNQITMLLCCNASGTEKLPPVICGPNENSRISDEVFAVWLLKFNERLILDNRKILLLIHRNRIRASSDICLSNINFLFFPKDFPSQLRPLRREIFHYVKMIYRQQFANKTKVLQLQWDVAHTTDTLLRSWKNVPRELIISSFQRTTFRCDDYFLEFSNPDFWNSLQAGISFRKFINFDDELSDAILNRNLSRFQTSKLNEPQIYYALRSRSKDTIICLDDEKDNSSVEIPKNDSSFEENKKINFEDSKETSCIIIPYLTKKQNDDNVTNEAHSKCNSIHTILDNSSRDSNGISPVVIQEIDIDYQDDNTPNTNNIILNSVPSQSDILCTNFESATIFKTVSNTSIISVAGASESEQISEETVTHHSNKKSPLNLNQSVSLGHEKGKSDSEDDEDILSRQIDQNNRELEQVHNQDNFVEEMAFEIIDGSTSYSGKRKNIGFNEEKWNSNNDMKIGDNTNRISHFGLKRQKTESNWSKQYETTFVFGSISAMTENNDSNLEKKSLMEKRGTTMKSQQTQTRNEDDTDKKCIYTLGCSSSENDPSCSWKK